MHKMYLSVLLIVVAAIGNVRGLQSITSGYGVESATFLSTNIMCLGLPINAQNAVPLGYCIRTSTGSKVLSANSYGELYSTAYSSSVCTGTPTGSDVALSSACACTSSSCVKANYYSTVVPALRPLVPSEGFCLTNPIPGAVITGSGNEPDGYRPLTSWIPYCAFDGTDIPWLSPYYCGGCSLPQWVQITLPNTFVMTSYVVTNNHGDSDGFAGQNPRAWTLQTSNDGGVTWTVVDTQVITTNPGFVPKAYNVSAAGSYTTYRWHFTGNFGWRYMDHMVNVQEIVLCGRDATAPVAPTVVPTRAPSGALSIAPSAPPATVPTVGCPAGMTVPVEGWTACVPCYPGSYSVSGGACTACPAGTVSAVGASACVAQCPPGSYYSGSAAACALCPSGTYQSLAGMVSALSCEPCPAGYYCTVGAAAPQPCPAGMFSMSGGYSGCSQCSAGTYASQGATLCTSCPSGKFSGPGASTCDSCAADWQSCRRVCPCRRHPPKPARPPTTATLQRCSRLACQRSRAIPPPVPHSPTPTPRRHTRRQLSLLHHP
jgi:hypothetical protein